MYSEITKGLFYNNVLETTLIFKVEEKEHFKKIFYIVEGVVFMILDNHVGSIRQYYIQDINA